MCSEGAGPLNSSRNVQTSVKLNKLTRGSPKLNTVCVYGHTAQFIYIKDFAWELLDRVIYKTLHGSPLDFSKIYILMNDELTLTYLKCLACTSLSVLCSLGPFGAIYHWNMDAMFLILYFYHSKFV